MKLFIVDGTKFLDDHGIPVEVHRLAQEESFERGLELRQETRDSRSNRRKTEAGTNRGGRLNDCRRK